MQLVITGIGGQGVVFLTRMVVLSAHLEGKHAISTETHGMAQRGASVISFIKIGEFLSPLIRPGTAQCAFCLKSSESARALSYLAPESFFFLDADPKQFSLDGALQEHVDRQKIRVFSVPATDEAHRLGNPRGSNLFLLGAALAYCPELPKFESICSTIRLLSPPKFCDINLTVVESGWVRERTLPAMNGGDP